jgi:hypothetical protein
MTMAKSKTTERDEKRDMSRRALIKWSLATGAALGVSRSRIVDILEKHGGRGIAEAATERPTCRSVHIIAGNGGFAWFQLLWPHNAVAAANNPQFAWHKMGQSTVLTGAGNNTLTIGPDTPWANLPIDRQVTAFMCGTDATHNDNTRGGNILNGNSIYAIASSLQSANSSVIRAVTIGQQAAGEFGTAAGSATPANVTDATGIVGLFNSAASRASGLLAKSADADLYKAHYDGLTTMVRASNRTTTKSAYTTGKSAAQFLGRNLSAQLEIKQADRDRYGLNGAQANVVDIGEALIIAVKAFKMGLTNCVALPAMRDDPHGAFNGAVDTVPGQLKKVLDGFMNDLKSTSDDITGQALDLDTVITVHGDTAKDAFNRTGWPDGNDRSANWAYVYSAGHLKAGWFGGATAGGNMEGFDANGKTTAGAYDGNATARYANASIAYALAKRDDRAISAFANGIKVAGVFGRPKTT